METTMGLEGLAVEQALRLVRLHQNMRQPIQTQQFKVQPLETAWEAVAQKVVMKAPLDIAPNTEAVVVAVRAMVPITQQMVGVPYTVVLVVAVGLVWEQRIRSCLGRWVVNGVRML